MAAAPLQNMSGLDEEELQRIYTWVDDIPLSRPKKNITRDFSDGVMMAEVVATFFPKLVDLHNYVPASAKDKKKYNWETLNRKVLRRINFSISEQDIEDLVNCVPGTVERVLKNFEAKVAKYRAKKIAESRQEALSGGASRIQDSPGQQYFEEERGDWDVSVESSRPSRASAGASGASSSFEKHALHKEVDREILLEKEGTIRELQNTIKILEGKISKLEQLVIIKDARIETLMKKQG